MPTTIYNSSLLTQRKRDTTISNSFINRIQNPTNPSSGSASLLGISSQSIINNVKNGQMTYFKKNNNGKTLIEPGCPCNQPNQPIIDAIYGWANHISANNVLVGYLTTDSDGNIYVCGVYRSNTVTIYNFVSGGNGGQIVTVLYGTILNNSEIANYLIKYNKFGQVQWATNIEVSSKIDITRNSYNIYIYTDTLNNVYMTGVFNLQSITINNFSSGGDGGPISLTPYGTLLNSTSDYVIYITKYNTYGYVQWATSITGINNYDDVRSIHISSLNDIYVCVNYKKNILTINNFDNVTLGNINVSPYGTLAESEYKLSCLIKYNTDGQVQWVTNLESTNFTDTAYISTDSLNNVYICGNYKSYTLVVNNFVSGGDGGPISLTPYGTLLGINNIEYYLIKYNEFGQAQWVTNGTCGIGGITTVTAGSISIDSSDNIYISGYYLSNTISINSADNVTLGNITVSPYGTLVKSGIINNYIAKYNTDGQVQWATSIVGDQCAIGYNTTDSFGNVYISGSYNTSSITINNFDNVTLGNINVSPYGTLAKSGDNPSCLIKYNKFGKVQWVTSIEGDTSINNVYKDSSDNIYMCGQFTSNTISINSADNVTLGNINVSPYGTIKNDGISNMFIVKYNTNGQV